MANETENEELDPAMVAELMGRKAENLTGLMSEGKHDGVIQAIKMLPPAVGGQYPSDPDCQARMIIDIADEKNPAEPTYGVWVNIFPTTLSSPSPNSRYGQLLNALFPNPEECDVAPKDLEGMRVHLTVSHVMKKNGNGFRVEPVFRPART